MSRPATGERPDPDLIAARDIEELEVSVLPWQFDMRQMSRGTMDARIHVGLAGDILATREHWSNKVVAHGVSPPGYLALGGTGSRKSFKWCGHEIDTQQVICGFDAVECDFATPDQELHWVLLIPKDSLANYLDPETVERLGDRRVLRCEPELSRRLFALADQAVQPSYDRNPPGLDTPATKVLRAQILEAASQLVAGDTGVKRYSTRRRRYLSCSRAIAYVGSLRRPISVSELATEVGVSRRTLERAFQENLGISPYKFSRLHRFNHLHRDLRKAYGQERSVTEILMGWGFSELGRTATEYRRLFGESPSTTLAKDPSPPRLRLADALVGRTGG